MKDNIKILASAIKITEGSTHKEFIFRRSSIQYFRKQYFIRTTELYSFHFFKITIDTRFNKCNISISNFDKHLETICLKNVNELPIFLDAFCDFYKLYHFDNQRVDDNVDALIYHSKIGRKSRQIFQIIEEQFQFKIQFFNVSQTLIHFNFVNERLFWVNQTIRFQEIDRIVIYLDKMKTSSTFEVFAIEAFLKNDTIISLIEMKKYAKPPKINYETISWISGKMVLSAVIELIEKLNKHPELDNIPIKLEIQ
ncbi:MAG: hypothetical protein AB8G11_26515 [Saprospiraceae bacterium]